MNPLLDDAQHGQFEFSGTGSEYFRIWIVNLALTLLTLGIYSAWAKVRRLQYFYRNTSLLGNGFDYHGDPVAILKGRLIGIGLLAAYNVAAAFSITVGIAVFVLLLIALPWLVQRSISFRLANSSYRGLRFRFNGSTADAYRVLLGWTFLSYITLGLLAPMAHQRLKAYQHNGSAYGMTAFNFTAEAGPFYSVYLKLLGLVVLPIFLFGIAAVSLNLFAGLEGAHKNPRQFGKALATLLTVMMVFYLVLFLIVGPWFSARIQNLVWNHTALERHPFSSAVRARDLLAIYVTNFIAIVLTLGLFKPFADIRLARYRLTHMALHPAGNVDEFFAREQQAVNAMGEETANIFDVDISF